MEEQTGNTGQRVSTPEEIAKYNEQSLAGGEITVPEPILEIPKAEPKKDENGVVIPEKKDNASEGGSGGERVYNPIWDTIAANKKASGEEWDIPKSIISGKNEDETELTPEVEYEMLNKAMAKKVEEDPFMSEYREASKEEGFDRETWLKRKSETNEILNKPSKDFLRLILEQQKNKEGERKYNDETIDEHLEGKNQIDLDREADIIKQQILDTELQKQKSDDLIKTKTKTDNINTFTEKREKETSNVLDEMASIERIGGMPHGEAERKAFEPIFRKLMQVDSKTEGLALDNFFGGKDIKGTSIEQDKAGNQRLYKALFSYFQGEDGATETYLSQFKEDFKQSILDKTDTAPRKQAGKVAIETPPTNDDFVI